MNMTLLTSYLVTIALSIITIVVLTIVITFMIECCRTSKDSKKCDACLRTDLDRLLYQVQNLMTMQTGFKIVDDRTSSCKFTEEKLYRNSCSQKFEKKSVGDPLSYWKDNYNRICLEKECLLSYAHGLEKDRDTLTDTLKQIPLIFEENMFTRDKHHKIKKLIDKALLATNSQK